ncbi:RES family NAD+ phosphorylase [Halomonas sp. I5-271120]|uniref:RES family NAD+ phosphorylase n=1 Tax=Halomonas sp. I5-271120 TaxID=3061632 RepID=UPI002714FC55|nr:RES family NAD+ phosphorylase [Halomonas sp. I5-271120]
MTSVRGYRLVKRKWLKTAFDGEGARLYGGRWNSKGKACVYLASTESLAMLEVMVHLEDNQLLKEYALLEVTFPEELLMQLPEDLLPADWRTEPAPPSTAEIGDDWLEEQSSLALAVPSVVAPRETNFLLNPEHPAFQVLADGVKEVDFSPDSRL